MIGHTGYLIFAVKTLPLREEVTADTENDEAEADPEAEGTEEDQK